MLIAMRASVRTVLALAFASAGAVGAAQTRVGNTDELAQTLGRVGSRVEEYYAHAQSIVALETVRVQRERRDMVVDGHVRQLTYELRVEWHPPTDESPAGEATIVRQLLSVDGRPPKKGDDEGCMDPEPVSPEPMMMLLPVKQAEYLFSAAGMGRTDGQPALMVDYKSRKKGKAEITWKDHCVAVSLPGWSRGRVFVDPSTHDVLRLDEELVGMFDFPVPRDHEVAGGPLSMTVERSDSSIHYRPVLFHDPDETVMLPRLVESTSVWRNAPLPRVRVTQLFSNYRRFLGDSRIVPDAR
jgi:hypothetical protein